MTIGIAVLVFFARNFIPSATFGSVLLASSPPALTISRIGSTMPSATGPNLSTSSQVSLNIFPASSTTPFNPPVVNASDNRLISSVPASTALLSGFSIFSYTLIPKPSNAEPAIVMLPFRLSFMVLAIFSDAPSAFLIEDASFLKSVSEAFTIDNNPDIASCPPSAAAAAAFSSFGSPRRESLIFSITSISDFMDPSEFFMEISYFSIAAAASFGGLASLVKMLLRAVPACVLLIPELAISPIA